MPTKANVTFPNFVGGELSPYMEGRVDLDLFAKSLEWCENFLIHQQGGASYRAGTRNVGLSKNNGVAALIPFQFSANDAYMMVATDKKFRFYRNEAVILNTAKNITGITQANPGVVTSTSHGFNNGDEVYITGVEGMSEVNGRFFLVANKTANTFELQDPFATNVNTTSYGAWSSGGTVSSIFELDTTYALTVSSTVLSKLRAAQAADTMYITHGNYPPRKLVRSGHTSWSLTKQVRTGTDPFSTAIDVTAMTIAAEASFTITGHSFVVGDKIIIEGTGTPQVANQIFIVKTAGVGTVTLYYADGVTVVNSTGWTHVNGNSAALATKQPAVVAFSADGRLYLGSTEKNPEAVWGSCAPTSGATRYDNFTVGTAATDPVIANLAPVEGIIDSIQEIKQFGKQFALLGASSIRRLYGSASDQPPTPTAINTQATIEGAASVKPVIVGGTMLFVDVSNKKLKGFQFSLAKDDYETKDYNLVADHLGQTSFIKLVKTKSDPPLVWVLRSDGVLLSFAFNGDENIAGWSRYSFGANGFVEDIAAIRRDTGEDQLWLVVKRTMGGKTYRSIEVMSNRTTFLQKRAFFTGNETADTMNYENANWERVKDPTFLDMTLTFDGTARGIEKNATITPSATTGTSITITSNNGVFRADHVGRMIWKRYDSTGAGGGQALITGYTSATQVTARVEAAFDNVNAITPGNWEFAVNTVTGIHLYEGLTVDVQTDGASHPQRTVIAGSIYLQLHAARVHVGFGYRGLLITQNIDIGGRSGPANSKPRNIQEVRMRFKDTVGCKVGASEYKVQELIFREGSDVMGRVPPPFSGMLPTKTFGMWTANSQRVVVLHDEPVPLTIIGMDVEVVTVDQI